MTHVMLPTAEHSAYMEELKATLRTVPDMPALEILAIASQFIGALCAAQDHRLTSEFVMGVVARNLTIGNQAAIDANITRQ
jgi:hypothetical protein